MNIEGKRVKILGLGDSGVAAARLCASHGSQVTVSDRKSAEDLTEALDRLAPYDIDHELGGDPQVQGYDLIVRSPGVPDDLEALTTARARGIAIWSEIELASRMCPAPIIGVTGTNGKGTTTTLIANILTASGRTTHLLGNIGTPFAEVLPQVSPDDVVVLEVSAAQLENSPSLAPDTAVLTNIRPEHGQLYDWDDYVELKSRIMANLREYSLKVIPFSEEHARRAARDVPGDTVLVDDVPLPEGVEGIFVDDLGRLVQRSQGQDRILLHTANTRALGVRASIPAAVAVALAWGASPEVIAETIAAFPGREHVLEFVDEVDDVRYVNDAKGTNPWSTLHGIRSQQERPVVLIAGGLDDKDGDFTVLEDAGDQLCHVVAFGPTAPLLEEVANSCGTDITVVEDFEEAIGKAVSVAHPGDSVLFSPGTHSWDIFPDYLSRGTIFKEMVARLKTDVED